MSAFEDAEREWLEANPHARSASYVPNAPTPAPAPEPELSAADLAEAAAFALSAEGRRMDPHGAQAIWNERVRRAEAEQAAAGEVRPAPGAQSVGGVEPDPKAWAVINEIGAARDPRTNRRYAEDLGISGQRVREMLDQARRDVFEGRQPDPAALKFARDAIAADRAAFEAEKAAKDAADLAEFRERRQ